MNVFFDVDDTILCGLDGTLRPHTSDVFARIRADGHAIALRDFVTQRPRA